MARVWDENWFGSTKTLDVHIALAAPEARRRPADAALPAHRARRRLPLHRARGVGAVSLRARLLLALAYVLVLAIVALEVPLRSACATASTPRSARRPAARPTSSRAAAADLERARAALDGRSSHARRGAVRGRVIVVDRDGRAARRLAPARTGWASTTAAGRRSPPRCAARVVQDQRRSDTLGAEDPRHRGADRRAAARSRPARCASPRASTPSPRRRGARRSAWSRSACIVLAARARPRAR